MPRLPRFWRSRSTEVVLTKYLTQQAGTVGNKKCPDRQAGMEFEGTNGRTLDHGIPPPSLEHMDGNSILRRRARVYRILRRDGNGREPQMRTEGVQMEKPGRKKGRKQRLKAGNNGGTAHPKPRVTLKKTMSVRYLLCDGPQSCASFGLSGAQSSGIAG
ncbi:hypothetical protein K438DRAFT_1749790 [Mycena galopus ATCC 62051]|nr:hypothetical protein K438DRAFT_1749790 [Mycena galopus ATCC 62051]